MPVPPSEPLRNHAPWKGSSAGHAFALLWHRPSSRRSFLHNCARGGSPQDEFGGHVRRILSTLDASRPGRVSTSPAQSKKERGPQESSTHRARTASGEVSSWRNRRSQGSGAKAGQLAGWTTPVSSEAHGRASLSVGVINPRERSEVHTRCGWSLGSKYRV